MTDPVFGAESDSVNTVCKLKDNIEIIAMPSVRSIAYLDLENAHRMINRFLNEKGMTKKELAESLDVTVRNLEQLFSDKIPAGLMSKVNLPLVRLYCNTKW